MSRTPEACVPGTAEHPSTMNKNCSCSLLCCGSVLLQKTIMCLCGWSLVALIQGLCSSDVSHDKILTNSLSTNVDHTLALLAAAAAPPSASILPSTIIVQVRVMIQLECTGYAYSLQHPALLARSAATFHKRAGYPPLKWASPLHYADR
jgi:hypothetical protein